MVRFRVLIFLGLLDRESPEILCPSRTWSIWQQAVTGWHLES
jgi:hypothetical protein